jgi:hypothetical protein
MHKETAYEGHTTPADCGAPKLDIEKLAMGT